MGLSGNLSGPVGYPLAVPDDRRLRRRQESALMRIGIIGSGHIGGTLTRRLTAAGHEVTVANSRGPGSLQQLATETGADTGSVEQAVRDGDVVVVAVPLAAVPALPADAFAGKVVVDADNYYPQRDGDIPEIADRSLTSSRWTANQLKGARVVKAFNTMYAQHLMENGRPAGARDRIALPVAADDAPAKQLVMSLVEDLGFDPVDAGTLDESWRQQPDTPVYGADRDADGVRRGLAEARP
ncbi:NADPH-dependent F420 reductase [Micromonospora cathayae]|uniref:NAD(P)-binding domain-containing protein n=1 Tax=Micromonospora cathayae TaxID=3028804 RepID=A0ABY7ZUU4_9ACTN|nr:NAD(P)-binding domain-containing protein [Micromonospora sp. HUAS 3]WDZ85808.1 NAD(P)-binding domain-containing protein [Micromonospora sp. HUAS 3]